MSFSLPKEWQDWLNLVVGIWILVSPWALNVTDNAPATRTAVAVGFLVIVCEVFTFWSLRFLEDWINILLGAWLVISAWLVDISAPVARANFIAGGVVLLLLAVYELWYARRLPCRSV